MLIKMEMVRKGIEKAKAAAASA
jgi:hypothetical protein